MKQRRFQRLVVRAAVVWTCLSPGISPAPAQELTSDWVQEMLRLPSNKQLTRSWQMQIKRLERLLLKDKPEKALAEGTRLAAEMVNQGSSSGSGQILGMVNALRAVAAYDLGHERQALWLWQTSLQIIPELSRYDLARFGAGVDFLHRNPPRTDADRVGAGASAVQAVDSPEDRVVAPVKRHAPPPIFPPAKPETSPLEVVVSVVVDKQGHPTRPHIVKAEGAVPLVFASLEALGEWEFEPATRDGEPIEFITQLTVTFRTKG